MSREDDFLLNPLGLTIKRSFIEFFKKYIPNSNEYNAEDIFWKAILLDLKRKTNGDCIHNLIYYLYNNNIIKKGHQGNIDATYMMCLFFYCIANTDAELDVAIKRSMLISIYMFFSHNVEFISKHPEIFEVAKKAVKDDEKMILTLLLDYARTYGLGLHIKVAAGKNLPLFIRRAAKFRGTFLLKLPRLILLNDRLLPNLDKLLLDVETRRFSFEEYAISNCRSVGFDGKDDLLNQRPPYIPIKKILKEDYDDYLLLQ